MCYGDHHGEVGPVDLNFDCAKCCQRTGDLCLTALAWPQIEARRASCGIKSHSGKRTTSSRAHLCPIRSSGDSANGGIERQQMYEKSRKCHQQNRLRSPDRKAPFPPSPAVCGPSREDHEVGTNSGYTRAGIGCLQLQQGTQSLLRSAGDEDETSMRRSRLTGDPRLFPH